MPQSSPARAFPDLASLFQDRYTDDAFERSFYARDLAPVPAPIARFAARNLPDAVVRPRTTAEVAETLRWATEHRVPVTPRAAATSAYWNAVPVRGGLLLDLKDLRGLVSVDRETLIATVLPATRWLELDAALRRQGLAVCSYPTSAPAATVGGWLNMQGHGVGSLLYGSLAEQIRALEVVLPDGTVERASPGSALEPALFAGAEGTLGVVTRVDLDIRLAPQCDAACLFCFSDIPQLQRAAEVIAALTPRPVYLHFADSAYSELLHRAGCAGMAGDGHNLAVAFEGSVEDVASGVAMSAATAETLGGKRLDDRQARQEWQDRFRSLRVKRAGPTLLAAESWLPLPSLPAYWERAQRLAASQRITMASYGMVVKPGWLSVMTVYPSNERRALSYALDLSLTRELYGAAIDCGGRPYGTGFWNAPYASASQSIEFTLAARRRNAQVDPAGIMNPGKLAGAPWWLHRRVFGTALGGAVLARRLWSALT